MSVKRGEAHTATDTTSGINTITITYTGAATTTTNATLTCDTPHQTCTWTAPVPTSLLGTYTASAHIIDQAGNTTTPSPIHITTIL